MAAYLVDLLLRDSSPSFGGNLLPRAGAWMNAVKSVFGFVFLGTAIWMMTPLALAQVLRINGTPGFVIGEEILRGATDLQTMQTLIARARESGDR